MRTNLWIPVVVLTALVAGVCAFLLTSPNERPRIPSDQLGFQQLHRERIDGFAIAAAGVHERADLTRRTRASATRAAKLWLDGIVGSTTDPTRQPRSVKVAATAPAQVRALSAFTTWADDLPRSIWKSTIRPATVTNATPSSPVTVPVFIDLTVLQATNRRRTQRVSAVLTLVPVRASADVVPVSWRLAGIRVGGQSTWLRAYADPVVVHRDSVDVVAPMKLADAAGRLADGAQAALPDIRSRFADIAKADVATIWILESADRAKPVLGRLAPDRESVGDIDSRMWVDDRGEIAIDWANVGTLSADRRVAILRHVITHLELAPVAKEVPPVLLEGVAMLEEVRDDPAANVLPHTPDLAPLDAAFERGDIDLIGLMSQDPGSPFGAGRTSNQMRITYLAGAATAAWIIDEHGRARLATLLRQLGDGVAVGRAVSSVLRTDGAGIQREVRAWTHARVMAEATPTPAVDVDAQTGAKEDT